jgi:hypothetical protein
VLKNTERAIKNGKSRETGNIGFTRRRPTKLKTQHNIYVGYRKHTKVNITKFLDGI